MNKADEIESDLDNYPHFSGNAYEAVECCDTYELSRMIESLEENINSIRYSEKEEYYENTYEAAIYVYQRDETGNSKLLGEKGVVEFLGNGKYFECEIKTNKEMLFSGDFDIIN